MASHVEALPLTSSVPSDLPEKYSPIPDTVQGEPAEIFPFMGKSRLAEVVDRHGADLVVRGHAHHGKTEGKTTGG
jgi:hypothetical protein